MKITRLRLLGFKSFVDGTELLVEPGLTGVVGPNGCGKSNLLEAIRWVMGETSYKSMRGAAMDDVIFAGTQNRPARNMAEVTVYIDNAERKAPAAYNDSDLLEVTRRIEREVGSVFRINGKDVRARDVRLLFEDAATGARSPALVRQGRIGEIVNAKPQDRRRLLEDAAGIAGLHSRRHEAELRLKAAESNLERLQDLMGQLKTQLNTLKRQARQARRYKEVSAEIRKTEALQHHVRWQSACAQVESEETALQNAVREVARLTQEESEASRAQSEAAEAMQPLREDEAARAAALHRLTVERDSLEQEQERAEARKAELDSRLAQLEEDLERERGNEAEARDLLERLDAEEAELAKAQADSEGADETAKAEADRQAEALAEAESALAELTGRLAELRAERQHLESLIERQSERIPALESQESDLGGQLEQLEGEGETEGDFPALRSEVERLSGSVTEAEETISVRETALAEAREAEAARRDEAAQARLRVQELETEEQTLAKLLKPAEDARWTPIVSKVRAEPGYERALGAALGDDLDASDDTKAPAHWAPASASGGEDDLPEGAEPLIRFVKAPKVLAARLSRVGVVDAKKGAALQAQLQPGQRLVSKEGDLWRWDGYAAAAEAPTAAAKRLAERNRLDDLTDALEKARAEAGKRDEAQAAAAQAVREAEEALRNANEARRAAQAELDSSRDAVAEAEHAAQESSRELGRVAEARTRTGEALAEARETLQESRARLETLEPTDKLESDLEAQRASVTQIKAAHDEARAAYDNLERERRRRADRLQAIAEERERWTARQESAGARIETLGERIGETRGEIDNFADFPAQMQDRRTKLMDAIDTAEKARQEAADTLAEAETALRERDKALREVQTALSEAREERARIEARLEAARERRSEQVRLISEHLDCKPEDCLKVAEVEPDAEIPELPELDTRVTSLKADRERLGGVNLAAEEEVEDISGQLDGMTAEQEDLQEAIDRLRQGISKLNREGRKRLLEAFDTVNGHFQNLFTTLFGGGEAELQLVEDDDPLESGLEIVARPPGKKPQVLTLLSGGEKALTALALLFAVFLTNPSPICVLDEVDAPLDDTNVERFCKLIEEMTRLTDTRFLIITHHPITMARMNRLFGVTMAERGVSQLVSVDLETAEQFRESA